MKWLGKFETIGEAWLTCLQKIVQEGILIDVEGMRDNERYIELKGISITIAARTREDLISKKYIDQEKLYFPTISTN